MISDLLDFTRATAGRWHTRGAGGYGTSRRSCRQTIDEINCVSPWLDGELRRKRYRCEASGIGRASGSLVESAWQAYQHGAEHQPVKVTVGRCRSSCIERAQPGAVIRRINWRKSSIRSANSTGSRKVGRSAQCWLRAHIAQSIVKATTARSRFVERIRDHFHGDTATRRDAN